MTIAEKENVAALSNVSRVLRPMHTSDELLLNKKTSSLTRGQAL